MRVAVTPCPNQYCTMAWLHYVEDDALLAPLTQVEFGLACLGCARKMEALTAWRMARSLQKRKALDSSSSADGASGLGQDQPPPPSPSEFTWDDVL